MFFKRGIFWCIGCVLILSIIGLWVANILFFDSTPDLNSPNATVKAGLCASCHAMKPMVRSFYLSIHGGNNKYGFAVTSCTDCHLPHNSLTGFLIAKGIRGLTDIFANIGLTKKANLREHYYHMKEFVFDSGCMQCHSNLRNNNSHISAAARFAHHYYFTHRKELSCVSCHNDMTTPNFAHPGLLDEVSSNNNF